METFIGCSIIINHENKVLIAKRSKIKKRYAGMWETIGGALENNESPEECIRREVMEEINCTINNLKLFNVYIINKDNRYVLITYTGEIKQKIKYNSEIERTTWINKDEINNYIFYGNEKEKIIDYFNGR